ncbi:hypothetical protein WDU94_005449, partial [Cyamophila willieti]
MSIPLPKLRLNTNTRKELDEFQRSLKFYFQANELTAKSDIVKVAILRSACDDRINDIIDTFDQSKLTVDSVFKGLAEELVQANDVSYEQYKFFNKSQLQGESFNDYYHGLKQIGQYCGFGEQLDTLIKSRIVFGIVDKDLQERLMRSPELTLKEIVNFCRASENAKSK